MKADNRADKRAPKGGGGLWQDFGSKKPRLMPGGGGGGAWQDFGGKKNLAYGNGRTEASDPVSGAIMETAGTGTSIFDPVLCELAYRWFCPPGGIAIDPFAGGSVRGIVASKLGRRYFGVDLASGQIAANRAQAENICDDPLPEWAAGDSRNIAKLYGERERADFIISCPPYADLEVYSDDPRDLSALPYAEFRNAYETIIFETCALLKPDRFALFVVGDARGADGCYYGLPWHTVAAFEAAGLKLYNEAVLVTAAGSLPLRAGKPFEKSRKLGKSHQNVLVFVKGEPAQTPPGRAVGGPVGAGRPYIVGERGPELFVPGRSGGIVPNHKLGSGGGVTLSPTFHFNIGGNADANDIEARVMRALERYVDSAIRGAHGDVGMRWA